MICPKCNKRYDESDKFCIDCGTKLIKNRDIQSVKPQVESEIGSLDVQLVNKKTSQYKQEAELADKVYKSYITNGLSRLDKINGRFLASQTIKLDIIAEQNRQMIAQNGKIIELLEKIGDKLWIKKG